MALYVVRAMDRRSRWLGGFDAATIKNTMADASMFYAREAAERVALLMPVPCSVVEI